MVRHDDRGCLPAPGLTQDKLMCVAQEGSAGEAVHIRGLGPAAAGLY